MWHSWQVKTKVAPKLSRHRKIQYSHSRRLTVSTKFYGIINTEISSQLVANIYIVVSEVGTLVYFEFKLWKMFFCRFPTLFLIQYSISMHERWIQMQWAVNWWSTAKSSYFGLFSFYQQLCRHVLTETYCWVRKQVWPRPYRTNRLRTLVFVSLGCARLFLWERNWRGSERRIDRLAS